MKCLIQRQSVRLDLLLLALTSWGIDTGQENDFNVELEKLEEDGHEGKHSVAPSKEDDLQVELTDDSPLEDKIIVKFQVCTLGC